MLGMLALVATAVFGNSKFGTRPFAISISCERRTPGLGSTNSITEPVACPRGKAEVFSIFHAHIYMLTSERVTYISGFSLLCDTLALFALVVSLGLIVSYPSYTYTYQASRYYMWYGNRGSELFLHSQVVSS